MPSSRLLVLVGLATASAFESEIISDIMTPVADERRSLEIKQEQFWHLVQKAAQDTKIDSHRKVFADVDAALAALPSENDHVRGLLSEALMMARRADEKVLEQAVMSSDLAAEKLATGPSPASMFNFMTGGQNFLSLAISRFVGGGRYSERVSQQVASRQAEVLPALRGAASVTSGVLSDCRQASQLSFDVLKYDIYNQGFLNKGAPKTPDDVRAAAYKLVDAVEETRHLFIQGVVGMANAVANDTREKDVDPSAKVTQTLRPDFAPFGSKVEDQSFNVVHEDHYVINEKLSINF